MGRVRTQSARTQYKGLNVLFLDSLEAFEGGKLLEAVQPILTVLDYLEQMHREREFELRWIDEKRIAEYRATLRNILPGNTPEFG